MALVPGLIKGLAVTGSTVVRTVFPMFPGGAEPDLRIDASWRVR